MRHFQYVLVVTPTICQGSFFIELCLQSLINLQLFQDASCRSTETLLKVVYGRASCFIDTTGSRGPEVGYGINLVTPWMSLKNMNGVEEIKSELPLETYGDGLLKMLLITKQDLIR